MTVILFAPSITWLLVITYPSEVMITPVPLPNLVRVAPKKSRSTTSTNTETTAGRTRSTTSATLGTTIRTTGVGWAKRVGACVALGPGETPAEIPGETGVGNREGGVASAGGTGSGGGVAVTSTTTYRGAGVGTKVGVGASAAACSGVAAGLAGVHPIAPASNMTKPAANAANATEGPNAPLAHWEWSVSQGSRFTAAGWPLAGR